MQIFQIKENRFYWFLFGIFVVNLLQAIFTPIIADEAEYWVSSTNLAWGYYDHPPMISFIIKLNSYVFGGFLSIRFLTVLFSIATSLLLWQLISKENKQKSYSEVIFLIILLAIPGFHIYGFITTPDVPLLFFFTLYLLVFRRFCQQNDFKNALLLGLVAALLIYSKYHGGVFILLTVILRIKLLKKWTIYFSGLIAFILLLPHLYWQFNHEFITFNYHLFQRTDGSFKLLNVGSYLVGLTGVLNPILVVMAIVFIAKSKQSISFYGKLFIAVLTFFFLYALRSRVEAHWIVAAFIPMLVVLHDFAVNSNQKYRIIKLVSIFSIALILVARVAVNFQRLYPLEINSEKKEFYEAIDKSAKGKKVVFVNSYQKASKYQFYIGKSAFSYNNDWYRKNQYDIENYEDEFHNQTVYMVGDYPSSFFDSVRLENGEAFLGAEIANFPVLTKLDASIETDVSVLSIDESYDIDVSIYNPYTYRIDYNDSIQPLELSILLLKGDERFYLPFNAPFKVYATEYGDAIESTFTVKNVATGKFDAWIVVRPKGLYYQKISKKYKVEIK